MTDGPLEYTPTWFEKAGEEPRLGGSWSEHQQLLFDGWTPAAEWTPPETELEPVSRQDLANFETDPDFAGFRAALHSYVQGQIESLKPLSPESLANFIDDAELAAFKSALQAYISDTLFASTGGVADVVQAQVGRILPDRTALGPWHAGLARRHVYPARVIFTGSSTTFGLNATSPFMQYTYRIARATQAVYSSGIPGYEKPVVATGNGYPTLDPNPGVQFYVSAAGGLTSENFINDVNRPFMTWTRPCLMMHMIGSNDSLDAEEYAVTPEDYEENIATNIDAIDATVTSPITHVLVHTYRRSGVTAGKWKLYLDALHRIAATRPNVMVVDISGEYERFDHLGDDPMNIIDTDLVHQTDAGHALMADLLLKALEIPPVTGRDPRVVLEDTFARSTATVGSVEYPGNVQWVAVGAASSQVDAGGLYFTAAGTVNAPGGLNDSFELDATIQFQGTGNTLPGITFCGDATDQNRLSIHLNPTTGTVQLWKTQGGTASLIPTTGPAKSFPVGFYRVKVIRQGDRIYGYVDGVKYIDYTLTAAEVSAMTGKFFGFRLTSTAVPIRFKGLRLSRLF